MSTNWRSFCSILGVRPHSATNVMQSVIITISVIVAAVIITLEITIITGMTVYDNVFYKHTTQQLAIWHCNIGWFCLSVQSKPILIAIFLTKREISTSSISAVSAETLSLADWIHLRIVFSWKLRTECLAESIQLGCRLQLSFDPLYRSTCPLRPFAAFKLYYYNKPSYYASIMKYPVCAAGSATVILLCIALWPRQS